MSSPDVRRVFPVAAVLSIAVWLAGSSILKGADAGTQPSSSCATDPVAQSICIYQVLLADVAKTYRQRGGGGISSIVQKSTTTFDVRIAQEGRADILTYTVDVAKSGKVRVVGKTETTRSY